MKGNNMLVLNEATLIEAVQEYLNRRMPTHAPVVQSVKPCIGKGCDRDGCFEVSVVEREAKP